MAIKTNISKISKVTYSDPGTAKGQNLSKSQPNKQANNTTDDGAGPGNGPGVGGQGETGKKIRTRDLSDPFIDKIMERLEEAESWDIGGVSMGQEGEGGTPIGPSTGSPISEYDEAIWGKDPKDLSNEIDRILDRGLAEEKKEEHKGTYEKTMGSGGSTIRDRIEIESISKTDWAKIFKSRLTEYSREASQYLPYHRRFVSNKMMRTKVPSRIPQRDILPELNLVIDTSSSLSYEELEVILAEVNKALSESKIKKVYVVLWASSPYYFKEYKDIDGKNFSRVILDIQNNWKGGGNDTAALYKFMKEKGLDKNFTLNFTDGAIDDHFTNPILPLQSAVLDPNNTVFGLIFNTKTMSKKLYDSVCKLFPGEKVPIFLDSSKFRK
jgi:hypothetical protein